MEALSSANLLGNHIPVEQAQELVKIVQAKEKLTTLCGLSKEETELDFSDQNLGAGDAVLIANDISDMGALVSINIENSAIPLHRVAHLYLKVLVGRLPSAADFVVVAVLVAALAWPFLSGLSLSPSP
jgi:hypothetical protein